MTHGTSDLTFSWRNYSQSTEEIQSQILEGMGFGNLGALPWRKQAELFQDAPVEVILTYFKDLHWEAQVKVWKYYLPADAEKWVTKWLKPQAAIALKLRPKKLGCLC